jgi:Mrp family chromosome partitioning ATPase
MGRLLEALKRLEPEMSALRRADPLAQAEILSEDAPGTNQTAILEPPAGWQDDYSVAIESITTPSPFWEGEAQGVPREISGLADRQSFEEAEKVENRPFEQVSAEIDDLFHLFDEVLPPPDEPDDFEIFSESNRQPRFLLDEPESKNNSIFLIDKPAKKKDPGVFGVMARNVLAALPAEGSAALFFTSPTDGEGKTETILPLAEALIAESGRRTILVDANLARPDLTREWRFNSRKGIFDVLTGEADWWEAVQETGLPKLSIMLNNGLSRQNAVIAQPLAFSELLENLKREYRLVLIDAASLAHAESIPMLRLCQGVYLVVRLGHSSPRTVREARQVVDQAGGKLLGCIAVGDVLAQA